MSVAPVENGNTEADMSTEEETWEQKEEPGGGEGGGTQEDLESGGTREEAKATGKEDEEMMEDEEEEMPLPKVAPAPPDAPKKEHVNVVFIGHVGVYSYFSILNCCYSSLWNKNVDLQIFWLTLFIRCW